MAPCITLLILCLSSCDYSHTGNELWGLHGPTLIVVVQLKITAPCREPCEPSAWTLSRPHRGSVFEDSGTSTRKLQEEKIGGIMASGMELAINNAEEAAVNAPFNSTGLQTPGQLFFLSCTCSTRGSYIRLYGFVCVCTARSFPRPQSRLQAINGFSSGARPNGVSNFTYLLRNQWGAVATVKEIKSTQSQNIWAQCSLNSESTDSFKKLK